MLRASGTRLAPIEAAAETAHAAIRKFYRFAVLRRRAKCISPSRVKDSGVEVGLSALFRLSSRYLGGNKLHVLDRFICSSSARAIRKTALRAYRGCRRRFTH